MIDLIDYKTINSYFEFDEDCLAEALLYWFQIHEEDIKKNKHFISRNPVGQIIKYGIKKFDSLQFEHKITFIYALIDPKTNEIRYIGKSDTPHKRIKSHISSVKTKSIKNSQLANWINDLLQNGLKPELAVLEVCRYDNWENKEKEWIMTLKNRYNLFNIQDGGICRSKKDFKQKNL